MRRFLLLALVLATLPVPPHAEGDADDKAIRELARRYFDAFAKKDLDGFMALWSKNSLDYDDAKQAAKDLFAETGPIEVKNLKVIRLRRDGEAVMVRVRVELAGNDAKTGKPHLDLGKQDLTLDMVREGGWKVVSVMPADVRLVALLLAADSKAERLRLLDDDADLIGPDFVRMILDEGDVLAERGQFDLAAALLDVAQEIAEGLGDTDVRASCQWYRGMVLKRQSRYGPALSSYRKALRLFRDANNRQGEGATLNGIGLVYEATGRFAEALQQYQDSLQIKRDLGDRNGEAHTLTNIGNVYGKTGRYSEALQQYRRCLKIQRDLEDRDGEATTLNNIGVVYMDTGRFEEALQQYKDSLKIARDLDDEAAEARTLANIGSVYGQTGRYAEALQQYQDSLKIARDLGNHAVEAVTLTGIGNVYHLLGRYAEALQQYQDGLKIQRDVGDRYGEAHTLSNAGIICFETGRYAEALQQYQDSLKIERALGDLSGEVDTLGNIANVYCATERYTEGIQQYQDILKIQRDLGDRNGEARTLCNIANVYALTYHVGALQKYQESLDIERDLGDLDGVAVCQGNLGRMYQGLKRWDKAAQAYDEAVHVTEQLRTNAREPSLQTSFLAEKTDPFFRLAECRLELRQSAPAFAAGEQMKARGLVDILRDSKANIRHGMSDDERKEEQRLQNDVIALGVQRENLQSRHADKDAQDIANRDLDKARQDLEEFRRALYLHRPDLATRRAEFAPASPDDLGPALFPGRPGLVVLSYLVGEDETLLFVLTAGEKDGGPAKLTVHRIDVGSKELAEAVNAFREGCSDPGKGEPDSDDLYRWLIAPAADELTNAKQVVIVPDGVLHTLPFQALRDPDGQYLIERFAVSYAPSVTALTKMEEVGVKRRKQYAGQAPSLLAVGISDFGRREKTLPSAEPEARAVAAGFGAGAKLLPGSEATRTKLEAAWSDRRYLHFATHGRLNPDAPLYSSLVLSPDGDEGALYARDLLDAEVPAELVVMSACHTGEGKHVAGEGLLGMSWSWFAAGVPSTVASQWSVGDDSTARLMKMFYARLAAGDSKAEALRQAERTLLKDDATHHPFYWAPFVLVGDDR